MHEIKRILIADHLEIIFKQLNPEDDEELAFSAIIKTVQSIILAGHEFKSLPAMMEINSTLSEDLKEQLKPKNKLH